MNLRNSQRALWTVLVIALIAIGAFALSKWLGQRNAAPPLDDFGTIPNFSLVNERGQSVSRDDLKGHIWIADLFFTRCVTVCPIMTGQMHTLQTALKDQPEIRLVSFSADPTNDSISTLATYAAEHGANPKQWQFLTGPVSAIYAITKDGFHLPLDSVGGDQNPPIVHSTRFVLIDARGHIRGYYLGSEADVTKKVLAGIDALKNEHS
ncbi:MAG: SCO family protein [Bacteroidota bacterium]|nr:SCO family protein [Bacteroidota bacterium]MDP4232610.1 SCO family protein [Bacteroidota bacterium]MDP4242936.1 SCO family protein [Bacteroidota bacterium]MDP4286489.1 SCO family protein [Bacteroidota bacterium]